MTKDKTEKSTSGPWGLSGRAIVYKTDKNNINKFYCHVRSYTDNSGNNTTTPNEIKGVAALIAASPDLYEALNGLYENCEAPGKYLDAAHKALAKARGDK